MWGGFWGWLVSLRRCGGGLKPTLHEGTEGQEEGGGDLEGAGFSVKGQGSVDVGGGGFGGAVAHPGVLDLVAGVGAGAGQAKA